MSRAIDWYYISQIGGGGSRVFWTPPPKIYWVTPTKFQIYHRNVQLKPSGTLFEQIELRGGSVDMSKSQRHTRSGARHGVSQANEAAIYPKLTGLCQHEMVSGILKKWKQCGAVQASYGCLVGHARLGVRISFLPHNSATLQFQVLMSMQMNACFKREQIGTLFVWVGVRRHLSTYKSNI